MVLAVATEADLLLIERKLQLAGIKHITIRESDPPYASQVTAIGLCPTSDRAAIKKVLSSVPLLGSESAKSPLVEPHPSTICNAGEVISR